MVIESPAAPCRPRASVAVRFACFLVAIISIGGGVALMVEADLGVAPNDVMNTGLGETLGWGVGTGATATSVLAMLLAWAMGRRPRPATIVGGFIVGTSINTALSVVPTPEAILGRAGLLAGGLLVVWAGITVVIAADIGAGPLELVMLALMDRGIGIRAARWGIELSLVAIGLALGGSAGIGTVIFALGTGPVLATTLPLATQRLGTALGPV